MIRLSIAIAMPLALSAPPALAVPADGLPLVGRELAEVREFCRAHAAEPHIVPGFPTLVDLDGDGRPDLVLDDEKARCRQGVQPRCGSGGCTVRVSLAMGDGFKPILRQVGASHRLERTPEGLRLTIVQKRLPPMVFRFAEGCAIPTTEEGRRRCGE